MVSYTRKKKGCKYIAQGTYGCVFGNPPLKCVEDDSRSKEPVITKLMDKNAADSEFRETDMWRKIDPTQDFSLTPIKMCKFDKKNIRPENNYKKCSVKYYDEQKYLITYPNGGPDLEKLKPKAEYYIGLLKGILNLFEGLVKSHENDIVHTDIKPSNILFGYNEIHLRFIDFGLSLNVKDRKYYDIPNDQLYTNPVFAYPYWPPELGCFDEYGNLFNLNSLKKYRFIEDFNKEYYNSVGLPDINLNYDQYYKMLSKNDFSKIGDEFKKVDVFSMGILLIYILRRWFSTELYTHTDYKELGLYFINKKTDDFSTFIRLNQKKWMSEEKAKYHTELYENITNYLFENVIKGCIDINPATRYDIKTAAQKYKEFLNLDLEKYLNKDSVIKNFTGLNILNESMPASKIRTPTPKVATPKEPTPKEPTPKVELASGIKTPPIPKVPHSTPATPRPPTPKVDYISSNENESENESESPPKMVIEGVPQTGEELKKIYYATEKYPSESNTLVKIARRLKSRVNFEGKTKLAIVNDIIQKAFKRGLRLNFTFKK
jgi:serine/threonine protein kinase